MRRFLTLVFLLCLAVPGGISISGCVRNPSANYCFNLGYGLKNTDVYKILLQPQIAGISLAYGQTIQAQAPTATTCTNATATISSKSYTYGTTNNQLVDISPTGEICAGTWNRNTGGGIADYTYCNYPNPLPSTNGLPYNVAYITASADSVTSNPVAVYVHAPVTAVNLVGPSSCQSQGTVSQLDAMAYYSSGGTQTLLCAPNSPSVPTCESSIGTLTFSVGNASVASINSANNQITAEQPGTTVITASIAGSGSSAGYFSTCPPASIKVSLANGATSGTIAQGAPQNLNTTVLDTNNNPITGLTLTYESTNPIDISTSASGTITTSFPGAASISAICEPATCNPAPINELGLNGTGLPISSNPVNVTVPGTASEFAWFAAPGQSQYVVPIELLTGTVGSNVRLPYVPNSMVMDQGGTNLYFGSDRELMIYSTASDTLTKQDPSAPGVVLAVSPNDSQLLINDQQRQVFYLYNATAGGYTTFGGMGAAAAWTPDSQTLYIADSAALGGYHSNTLYVYNSNTGWSSCSGGSSCAGSFAGAESLAVTIPGVGAYFSGTKTVSRTWCPLGTVGGTLQFYPQGDSVNVPTNVLGATLDGGHILGATWSGTNISLADIGLTVPTTECPGAGGPALTTPLSTSPTLNGTATVSTGTNVNAVNQVVTGAAPTTASTSTAANIAFVTYSAMTGSTGAAQLPYYLPQASGTSGMGTFSSLTFADSTSATPPTAPLAGAFSPDDTLFFVSTAGDNEVHYISIPATLSTTAPPTDSKQVSPNLPACTPVSAGGVDAGCTFTGTGTVVPATAIAIKPRSTT